MSRRPAFSLVEALVALVLVGLVCSALAGLLGGFSRLGVVHAARVEAAETLRIPAVVLAGELRWLEPRTDLPAVGPDSVVLRAFRGGGVVCDADGARVFVRYRGVRLPNPAKDSVVFRGADLRERTAGLQRSRRAADACAAAPGETVLRWRLDAVPTPGTAVLLFERGSYHLTGSALRYRRGRGGRQPLTVEWLADERSGIRTLEPARDGSPAGFVVRLALRAVSGRLPLRLRPALHRVRVFLPNRSPPAVSGAGGGGGDR